MQKKSIVATMITILAMLPVILFGKYFGDRHYYISAVLIIILAMVPFFLHFENRKPQARELVTIAVMCAIAVISRVVFIMLPGFKPMVGLIIIAGMALGPEAGFITGAFAGLISNFVFGQGPWTPWQMFAFGIAGLLGGVLCKNGFMKSDSRIFTALFGGFIGFLVVGPILDTCTLFTMASVVNTSSVMTVYLTGIPFNAMLGVGTFVTMLLVCRPMTEKLERIKKKYGLMQEYETASQRGEYEV